MSSQDDFVCKYCGKIYADREQKWCKPCQIDNLRNNFKNWTSGNEKIDELIQEMQLKISHYEDNMVEWIPYNQFKDIKEIGRDDFTALYSAIWIDGPLLYNQYGNEKEWIKEPNVKVSLKCLYNSQNITNEFLNEVNSYPINYEISIINNIPTIYGITQNPETKDYILVFKDGYCEYCGKIYTNIDKEICICYMKNDWASGNEQIDEFIQEMQLVNIGNHFTFFEWIPYIQFNSIKQIGKDDSTTLLYSAIWMDGPLKYTYDEKLWKRVPNEKVILKCLYNSQNHIINEFLNEAKLHINKHNIIYDIIYGITQNPDTNDYIMVLRDNYCKYCSKIYTYEREKWCTPCQINILKQNFTSWTSGNEKIDELIQEMQLNINYYGNVIVEWIAYNQFIEIKELNKDSSGTLYSAIWMDGPLKYDSSKIKWERVPNKEVILKFQSQNIINKFLNEIKSYTFNNYYNYGIYGISQDPVIKDYIIVSHIDNYCKTCGEIYICRRRWCMLCQVNILKENFAKWTSGNEKIDNFIQEMQLKINKFDDTIVEWIPYNQFNYIKEIGKGGFATVYSAIWMDGPLIYDYDDEKEYERKPNEEVALKCLNNSQNITDEFLSEIKNYSIKNNENILQIYGISQNPNTKDYIMVLQYAESGNFDNYINDIINWFWFEKLIALGNIIKGLKKIHENKMVHRDFHTGNILTSSSLTLRYALSGNTSSFIYISDMGLCGEVSNTDEKKIYGVMPFVAPEVLKGNPYTQAADIYSFGMIMYFIATTKQPFANCAHDNILALNICNGIRPEINEKEAPKCYIDLMKRCWDSNPANRPSAIEISELVELFDKSCDGTNDEKIGKQFVEAEEYRKANLLSIKNGKLTTQHPQAYYNSRLLNPFTKDLSKYDNINNNSVEIIDFMKISIEDESKDKQSEEKSKV
ncbi:Ssk22p [Rhizophagus irregularis DAOM 197198w]|uniref:Ssk22p n=4 Tax=Rhizophagus irregularis TaxID=588596 RepID=A0A015IVV3_RHIIW|nr:Ssk22p [Rhizophagus irregularis DAOM 197198w]